jgi:hypothetical protein
MKRKSALEVIAQQMKAAQDHCRQIEPLSARMNGSRKSSCTSERRRW